MTKILVTGGTGLVGQQLILLLKKKGHTTHILTRNPQKNNEFLWDLKMQLIDDKAFEGVEYIVHLAGAGIADKRWSDNRKQEILNSRVQSTALLYQKVNALKVPLKGFISASATGFYGAITTDIIFTETDKSSDDFLGEVCESWENAAFEFKKLDIPVTVLRTGIVLTKTGGALEKMKTPIISPLGSGKQYLPWIHIDDLINLYVKAIEDPSFTGVYNAVAPDHQTNYEFSKELATLSKRPFIGVGVPSFLLKLIFGKLAVILLEGSRVSSEKLKHKKFIFTYPNLKKALGSLLETLKS